MPWEIGLAETQQTLLRNDLRRRITVQTDGQLKTGRDVVIAALLGADEMGFSTAPLIATGCIMMRACHLNTCPVGIATQDPELRKRFQGQPEHVVNFFFFVAEEVREIMASLGVATFDELIGRTELLDDRDRGRALEGARHRPLAPAGTQPELAAGAPRHRVEAPPGVLDDALDWDAGRGGAPRHRRRGRPRRDREAGAQRQPLRRRHPQLGRSPRSAAPRACAEDAIEVTFRGSAGQSFGGWLAPGVAFTLLGDANDYTGKGLSGGVLAVRPPEDVTFARRGEPADRQHRALRRHQRARVLPRPGRASASRCATRAPARSSRASATTAAST